MERIYIQAMSLVSIQFHYALPKLKKQKQKQTNKQTNKQKHHSKLQTIQEIPRVH